MSDTIQVSRAEMLALKATLLSLREALEVTSVALDKALTAKAEEVETLADAPAPPTVKAAKKPRANKGKSTAWSEWTVLMKTQHAVAIEAYIAQRIEDCKAGKVLYTADQAAVKLGRAAAGDPVSSKMANVGAHLSWLKAYKAEHEAEWLSFKTQWEVEHPKGSRTSSVTGDASDAGSAVEGSGTEAEAKPKRGRKPMTQEQKDVAKAKREAKKAAVEFDPLASQSA